MLFKAVLFLAGVHAVSGVFNGSSIVRTFARRLVTEGSAVTDEPIDLDLLDYYPDIGSNGTGVGLNNVSGPGERVGFINGSRLGPLELGSARNATEVWSYTISVMANNFLTGHLSTIFIPTLYTFVFFISVPLNIVAMVTFAQRIRPMKPAVIYMLNLAAADLLFALLLPFKIVYHYNGNDWGFGEGLCRLVTAAFYCNMYCSILLMTCVSVDRLLAVAYPINSLAWRSPRNAALACSAMWILAVGGSLPLVLSQQTVYYDPLDITTCHDIQDLELLEEQYVFFFPILSCTLYFLPLFIMVTCYSRVVQVLNKAPRGVVGRSRQKARAVVMAVTVLVVFVVCFTPTNSILLAHYLQIAGQVGGEPDATHVAYLVSLCLGSISCCLDPLVYYFGSSQCQRQLEGALGCQVVAEGRKSLASSSGSSRTSTRTRISTRTSTRITKVDTFQASLSSQYKKLLV
ncbi:proteinase-activated receptor 1-like [Salvelinus fontinalis]|uniref:proteinase-activated receptor 1-like n=1 Tax=Salvelinus fontinalis TaxID=8038 RepID=UPI002485AA89|nr:proteinase-activated receptor 1-like [Salvelinus fontinalis]